MATKKTLCRSANGAFVRNLGWKRTPTGYAQHKFHLGRDESAATLANLRLEHLWQQVVQRWERENGREVYPTDRPSGTPSPCLSPRRYGRGNTSRPSPCRARTQR